MTTILLEQQISRVGLWLLDYICHVTAGLPAYINISHHNTSSLNYRLIFFIASQQPTAIQAIVVRRHNPSCPSRRSSTPSPSPATTLARNFSLSIIFQGNLEHCRDQLGECFVTVLPIRLSDLRFIVNMRKNEMSSSSTKSKGSVRR
jgi:hypothetical protein